MIVGRGGADARQGFFGDDEQVDRRLRLDVVQNDAVFVLVLDFGGDFAGDDALEKGLGHGRKLSSKSADDTAEF